MACILCFLLIGTASAAALTLWNVRADGNVCYMMPVQFVF